VQLHPLRSFHLKESNMAVTIDVDLEYEFEVKSKKDKVFALLSNVPESASHFPKVESIVDQGKGVYRWEMARVGTPQVYIQTVYACTYKTDAKKGSITWTPVKKVGNAQVSGGWTLEGKKSTTLITLELKAVVTLDLPSLMQSIAEPIVNAEFENLVDTYIDNLIAEFGGEVE
jgi:carbon monoxide dehydrogenase subunit G